MTTDPTTLVTTPPARGWARLVRGRPMDAATVHRRRWWTLVVLNVSLLLIVMDNTILNVALPTLARDLGASAGELQWIVDSYVLVFAGLLLCAGALGDRFGRRGALSAGLVIFGVGSAAAMLSDSASMLIAARAFMGVGGALIMPTTLSILTNVFTDPKERATAIAMWATIGGLAMALGPIVGGWLLEHFSWSSMFAINLPIVVLALAAGRVFVPTSRDPHTPPLDITGAIGSILGLGSLVWAIIEAGEHGWTAAGPLTGFAVAAVTLAVFVAWERRTPHPMLDISFFRNRRFSAASIGVMLGYFAMFGAMFLLTQLLQFVFGYSPLEAGVRVLPLALAMAVFSTVSAKLVEIVGTKIVVVAGMGLVAGGLMWAGSYGVGSDYGDFLPVLIVMGTGIALTWAPTTESIMGSLPPEKAGVGSAVNDTVREVGGALGVAVLGSVLASQYSSADGAAGFPADGALLEAARVAWFDGFQAAMTVAAVVAAMGALVAAIWLPARSAPTPEPVATADDNDRAELTAA